jgi:DNA-binding MarR family transcriptional regulator
MKREMVRGTSAAQKPAYALDAACAVSLDRTLTYRLHLLHKISDKVTQRAYEQQDGLSMSDGRCLATVGTFEPLSINDLARASNLNKGQASRAAQSLVDLGLARKQEHPEDGRGVVLTLTPKGRRRWKTTMQIIHRRNQEIFSCLAPDELTLFSAFLDRLIQHALEPDNDQIV